MLEQDDKFYVYSNQDIATMLEGLLTTLIQDKDVETFEANCDLIEAVIFQARERMAGIKSDPNGGGVLS